VLVEEIRSEEPPLRLRDPWELGTQRDLGRPRHRDLRPEEHVEDVCGQAREGLVHILKPAAAPTYRRPRRGVAAVAASREGRDGVRADGELARHLVVEGVEVEAVRTAARERGVEITNELSTVRRPLRNGLWLGLEDGVLFTCGGGAEREARDVELE